MGYLIVMARILSPMYYKTVSERHEIHRQGSEKSGKRGQETHLLASSLLLLTCAGTVVPISSADAKGDMRMVIFLYAMSREMSWTLRIFLALGQFS